MSVDVSKKNYTKRTAMFLLVQSSSLVHCIFIQSLFLKVSGTKPLNFY